MKIIITFELDDDSSAVDPNDDSGLTEGSFNYFHAALRGGGADDIDIRKDES